MSFELYFVLEICSSLTRPWFSVQIKYICESESQEAMLLVVVCPARCRLSPPGRACTPAPSNPAPSTPAPSNPAPRGCADTQAWQTKAIHSWSFLIWDTHTHKHLEQSSKVSQLPNYLLYHSDPQNYLNLYIPSLYPYPTFPSIHPLYWLDIFTQIGRASCRERV